MCVNLKNRFVFNGNDTEYVLKYELYPERSYVLFLVCSGEGGATRVNTNMVAPTTKNYISKVPPVVFSREILV